MAGDNLQKNEKLRENVVKIVEKKKCTLNQLALAWVHHKGKDVVPIPGTTKRANLESNIGAFGVTLTADEMAEIEAAVPLHEVSGERYPVQYGLYGTWRYVNSPPLSSWSG